MKLEPIIYKLKNDELCAIQIFDLDTNNRLLPIKFWEQIQQQYGSFENMLQTFYNQGVTRISVQEYRKNGSNATKKIGNSIEVSAEIKKEPVQQNRGVQQTHYQPLNSPMTHNAIPLSIDEVRKIDVYKSDAVRFEIENKFLKDKIELLETLVDDQKATILEHRFNERGIERDLETRKSNNEFYLGLAQEFGPTLGPALTGMFNKGSKAVPLAQPAFNLSEEKQKLFDVIKDNSFSNSYAIFIDDIIYKLQNDQQFYNDLVELINKKSQVNEN